MKQTLNEEELAQLPWYKHRWPWILMAGPAIVVCAAFYTFYLAQKYADDVVSDDYYKEGKYINMQLQRDVAAVQQHLNAQVLFNDEYTAAKVFIEGEFDRTQAIKLSLLHPAKKTNDQTVTLQALPSAVSGNKVEYMATFQQLPPAVHWYVRLEDETGKWRIENKWLPSQSAMVNLTPKNNALLDVEVEKAEASMAK